MRRSTSPETACSQRRPRSATGQELLHPPRVGSYVAEIPVSPPQGERSMSSASQDPGRTTPAAAVGQSALGLLSRIGSVLRRHIAERLTRHTLTNLNDHRLKDIGVRRSDIEAVARRVSRG